MDKKYINYKQDWKSPILEKLGSEQTFSNPNPAESENDTGRLES